MKSALTALALALALVGPASAQSPQPVVVSPETPGAPVSLKPEGKDKAVVDDIERTLKELSGHLTVGAKRIPVAGGGGGGDGPAADVTLPTYLELAVGKAQSVDLPSDAREVVIGNPATLDVSVSSRRRLFVMGRTAGRSNVFVLGGSGQIIARMEVSVGADADGVRAAIQRSLPDEDIKVEAQGESVVLSGSVSSDGAAGRMYAIARRFVRDDSQVVNLVKVRREQQVLIQVKVAEVQRSVLRGFGINTTIGDSARFFSGVPLSGSFSSHLTTGSQVAFGAIRGITTQLELLEERGLVRNLAEPNLVAVSGEIAAMLAGGEIPIPVSDDDGITIQYRPFGVTLSFLPVILDGGRINMKLTTEVSAVSDANATTVAVTGGTASYKGFTVRRASSTVELPNGGSLMIAGLIQNDITDTLNGIPGVMNLPILGALFRSESFRKSETELVVLVTATLVRPTGAQALVTPADAIAPGGDLDRWMFGRLTGRYAPGFHQDRMISEARQLPYGFSLDEVSQ